MVSQIFHRITKSWEEPTEFVSNAEIDLLPQLLTGLNQLISSPPVITCMYCEVSERFQWLMEPACEAVKRLIEDRHPASLEEKSLTILHKFLASRVYRVDYRTDFVADFSRLVPTWKELNWALFWFDVKQSREAFSKKSIKRITFYWQAQVSHFDPFWQFEEADFESVVEEITHQTFLDDRLVALSLALMLFSQANQPKEWLDQLNRVVAGNDELSHTLDTYFNPSPPSQAEKQTNQMLAEQKKQIEAHRRKQENYHKGWKKFFNEKLDEARAVLQEQPGALTHPILYLYEQTQPTAFWTYQFTHSLISGE